MIVDDEIPVRMNGQPENIMPPAPLQVGGIKIKTA